MKVTQGQRLATHCGRTAPPVVAALGPKTRGKTPCDRVTWLARPALCSTSPWVTCPVSRVPGRWTGACLAGLSTSTSVSAPPQSTTDSADSASGVPVNLSVQFESSFGEVLKVVGSSSALGNWGVASAPMMTWTPGHVWQLQVVLEPGQVVEYKLARQTGNGVTWEDGLNRQLKVPKRLMLDDEEFGGSTLISANLVWGDIAASSVQIVVQQPSVSSISSLDIPDSISPPPPPVSASIATPQPPIEQATVPATATAIVTPPAPVLPAGESARGSRFQANFARTPSIDPATASLTSAGSSTTEMSPLDPSLPAGVLIQPEAKPVKFRFKRLGSVDEVQAEQSQSSATLDLPPISEDVPVASVTSQITSAPPTKANTPPSSSDLASTPTASADIPPEVIPVSFRFRRLSSQDSQDEDPDTDTTTTESSSTATNKPAVADTPAVTAGPATNTLPNETTSAQPETEVVKSGLKADDNPVSSSTSIDASPSSKANPLSGEKQTEEKETTSGPSAEVVSALNSLLEDNQAMTGPQLRKLVFNRWKRHYDVQLTKLGGRMYFQVMWKFLEQKSFPMTESQYDEKLDAIAYCISEWGVVEVVMSGIDKARGHPGHTTGGGARCISIPLGVDLDGARREEFSSSRR